MATYNVKIFVSGVLYDEGAAEIDDSPEALECLKLDIETNLYTHLNNVTVKVVNDGKSED